MEKNFRILGFMVLGLVDILRIINVVYNVNVNILIMFVNFYVYIIIFMLECLIEVWFLRVKGEFDWLIFFFYGFGRGR